MIFHRLALDAGVAHAVRTFGRGEELIDALIEVLRGAPAPVACFIDVKMPGMGGFDVLRWIRCQRPLESMAVVMLSSSDAIHDLNEALAHGAQCYLTKFPTPEQFAEILRHANRIAAAAVPEPFKVPGNLLLAGASAVYH